MNLTALRASARRKISFQATASQKYLDVDLDANLNEWYRTVVGWVMAASGIWEFNGEVYEGDLVNGQAEYVFPVSFVLVNRIEIKYSGSDDYVVATRIDDKQVTGAFGNNELSVGSTAKPVFRLLDNSLFLYPVPTANSTDGIRIEVLDEITDLSSGSDIPNLNPLCHKVLAIGAAYEYCQTLEQFRKASSLLSQILGRPGGSPEESLKHQIETLASMRDRTVKQRIIPRVSNYR